jgi:hypothetical protein
VTSASVEMKFNSKPRKVIEKDANWENGLFQQKVMIAP